MLSYQVSLSCYPSLMIFFQGGESIDFTWSRYKSNKKILKIKSAELEDTGVFGCKGINGFGSDAVRIELIIVGQLNLKILVFLQFQIFLPWGSANMLLPCKNNYKPNFILIHKLKNLPTYNFLQEKNSNCMIKYFFSCNIFYFMENKINRSINRFGNCSSKKTCIVFQKHFKIGLIFGLFVYLPIKLVGHLAYLYSDCCIFSVIRINHFF